MMKRIIKALIYLYREGISRYTQPRCIYIPTCSSYALEAIDRFGAIRGGLLSVWRILRCNPFSKGGYDPVPERFTFRREYLVYCKKKKKDKRR
jgi:putative membrane protein insertion efficiency factor